jgi:hypothetical protein
MHLTYYSHTLKYIVAWLEDEKSSMHVYFPYNDIEQTGIMSEIKCIRETGHISGNIDIGNENVEIRILSSTEENPVYNKTQYILLEDIIVKLSQRRTKLKNKYRVSSIYKLNDRALEMMTLINKKDYTDDEIEHLALTQSTKVYKR